MRNAILVAHDIKFNTCAVTPNHFPSFFKILGSVKS
ncbi:hypothetical protein Bcell_1427 [Evansella cellulosilytica DSM 2522]|uniref:Uncharacterized protein n=1 Tax=Evansella cellulosilytica (strain ATCC 21833 / DSM 2522 / FERM P-1141 / JCM 9156 / N-4) TaxID=649639 RepID=E6TUD4_EVAC2|nr:hypothetical protein Bcell_1427 [Evansella cellulosilytica DSM 2522]